MAKLMNLAEYREARISENCVNPFLSNIHVAHSNQTEQERESELIKKSRREQCREVFKKTMDLGFECFELQKKAPDSREFHNLFNKFKKYSRIHQWMCEVGYGRL